MDQTLIQQSAIKLEALLRQYAAADSEAAELLEGLKDLVFNAKIGGIKSPIDRRDIPGSWYFFEGNLRQYKDLEEAFAEFKFQITGGETPARQATLQRIAEIKAQQSKSGQ
ncbi:hypothetical protein [Nitrospirillum sp. BR 11163]|uniref:hypothetical protein n=1 Tax=Nitrospirillum sp. BR 11163 TaxID=3104323 RepID=UPI002AFF35ED|nr:hypothetical protein [Nitrospirillum sp. BR 11163]MEA1677407.1 hypothetical protein [Nitrospirillum sp. BR 11163]